jgi:hypothetical protein
VERHAPTHTGGGYHLLQLQKDTMPVQVRTLKQILDDLKLAKRTYIQEVWIGEQVEELTPKFSSWWESQRPKHATPLPLQHHMS